MYMCTYILVLLLFLQVSITEEITLLSYCNSLGIRAPWLPGWRRSVLPYHTPPPTHPISKDAEGYCGLARLQSVDWATVSVGGAFKGMACLGMASLGNAVWSSWLLWKLTPALAYCVPQQRFREDGLGKLPSALGRFVPCSPSFFSSALLSAGEFWSATSWVPLSEMEVRFWQHHPGLFSSDTTHSSLAWVWESSEAFDSAYWSSAVE